MCKCENVTTEKVELLPPWQTYWKELDNFFTYDDEVFVGQILEDGQGGYKIPITVDTPRKAFALAKILRKSVNFGNVDVEVDVRLKDAKDTATLVSAALDGNALCRKITEVNVPGGIWTYAELAPEVIQFPNDDLRDVNGNSTYLAQDIARDIFEVSGAHFCTVNIAEN